MLIKCHLAKFGSSFVQLADPQNVTVNNSEWEYAVSLDALIRPPGTAVPDGLMFYP